MNIKKVNGDFVLCRVDDFSKVDFFQDYVFVEKTKNEHTLICLKDSIPSHATEVQGHLKAFYLEGSFEFSLLGIIAGISSILANNRIPMKIISTHNTDYIFVNESDFDKSLSILHGEGYQVVD